MVKVVLIVASDATLSEGPLVLNFLSLAHTYRNTSSGQLTQYKPSCVEPEARSDTDDPTHDKRDVIWYQSTTHSTHHSHQMAGQNHRLPANPRKKVTNFIL